MNTQFRGHILLFPYDFWGHVRPALNFAVRLVTLHRVHVTVLLSDNLHELAQKEVARSLNSEDPQLANHIRLIVICGAPFMEYESTPEPTVLQIALMKIYGDLVARRPIICTKTGVEFDPLPAPTVALVDVFGIALLRAIEKSNRKDIKVFTWLPIGVGSTFRLMGPPSVGGSENPRSLIEAQAKATGSHFDEAAFEFYVKSPRDSVGRVSCLPPMYDYEYTLQVSTMHVSLGRMLLEARELMTAVDGLVTSSSEIFEPEAISGMRKWFGAEHRRVYACGPVIPLSQEAHDSEKTQAPHAARIDDFLEKILKSCGKRSLIYIAFGTLFWPSEPERLWVFLDVLMKKKIPFIFSHASRLAVIPAEVEQKVNEFDFGLLSPWSPQQAILAHPATGWFVTHCGLNSLMESMTHDIPMMCWPFGADQGPNAIQLTHLNIAYEFLEVRTGDGLQPIFRLGKAPQGTLQALREELDDVLSKAFGEDGKEKTRNVERLGRHLRTAWDEGGSARQNLDDFAAVINI